jgi:arylformamidase
LPIYDGMPVYPGTIDTKIEPVKSGSGTSVLSNIQMSSHTGTHVDSPVHGIPGGETLKQLDLQSFYGPARVLDMTKCSEAVGVAELQEAGVQAGERVLLKTKNSLAGFDKFRDDFIYLAPDAAEYLGQLGVALVGIDALSIKQRGAKENTSHVALMSRRIPILEGINLKDVEEGEYTLAAFPIALQYDGAPARAVLIS